MNKIPNASALQAKFQETILGYLTRLSSNEELAISFVSQELRYDGWKGMSNLGDLEDTLKAAGFSFRKEYNASGALVRTYVTL